LYGSGDTSSQKSEDLKVVQPQPDALVLAQAKAWLINQEISSGRSVTKVLNSPAWPGQTANFNLAHLQFKI
jgi:hypothetical protein